jgi:hypothetical protein
MTEHEEVQDPTYTGTYLQQQFSKTLSDMLKSSSSSDTEAMQVGLARRCPGGMICSVRAMLTTPLCLHVAPVPCCIIRHCACLLGCGRLGHLPLMMHAGGRP